MKGGEPMTNYVHFRVEIFAKVIDTLAVEMDRHFTETNTNLLRCVMCLDPSNCFASFDQDRLLELAVLYSEDFSSTDRVELIHELQNYISDMKLNKVFANISNLGSLAKKMVGMNYHTFSFGISAYRIGIDITCWYSFSGKEFFCDEYCQD
ncbi:unnamed protein product [Cuscuta campestris]|uniref:Uncharacterized protein n=1 Tax=Cuscuta campestris TaxID=132261 RepID=A0A484KZ62_9ASTE|nr:unnamed protein product [Cuscuta campestris]